MAGPTRAELLDRIEALEKRLRSLERQLARKDREAHAHTAELAETREREAATSAILRVIASSPTDVQPIFDAIAESAVRLCDGLFSAVYRFDCDLLHLVAHHNFTPEAIEAFRRAFPAPPSRSYVGGRAILDRAVAHIPDVDADPEWGGPVREGGRALGYRSNLAVPMLLDGRTLGAITVARRDPGPFSDKQIALLQTFADQAVIAIENVRLFTVLQARNRDLTAAL